MSDIAYSRNQPENISEIGPSLNKMYTGNQNRPYILYHEDGTDEYLTYEVQYDHEGSVSLTDDEYLSYQVHYGSDCDSEYDEDQWFSPNSFDIHKYEVMEKDVKNSDATASLKNVGSCYEKIKEEPPYIHAFINFSVKPSTKYIREKTGKI